MSTSAEQNENIEEELKRQVRAAVDSNDTAGLAGCLPELVKFFLQRKLFEEGRRLLHDFLTESIATGQRSPQALYRMNVGFLHFETKDWASAAMELP